MAKLVSKVYSNALFDAVKNSEKLDIVYEEVKEIIGIFKDNIELKKLLDSPKIVKEDKIKSLENIFANKISKELMGLMVSVVEKGRQTDFVAIFEEFIRINDRVLDSSISKRLYNIKRELLNIRLA